MTPRTLFATLAAAALALGPAHGDHVKVQVAVVPPDAKVGQEAKVHIDVLIRRAEVEFKGKTYPYYPVSNVEMKVPLLTDPPPGLELLVPTADLVKLYAPQKAQRGYRLNGKHEVVLELEPPTGPTEPEFYRRRLTVPVRVKARGLIEVPPASIRGQVYVPDPRGRKSGDTTVGSWQPFGVGTAPQMHQSRLTDPLMQTLPGLLGAIEQQTQKQIQQLQQLQQSAPGWPNVPPAAPPTPTPTPPTAEAPRDTGTPSVAARFTPWQRAAVGTVLAAAVGALLAAMVFAACQRSVRQVAVTRRPRSRLRQAADHALRQLRQPGVALRDVREALREVLTVRCNLSGGELTPREAEEALGRAGVADATAHRCRELLDECDRVEFGAGQTGPAELAKTAAVLVEDITTLAAVPVSPQAAVPVDEGRQAALAV
jgi:hypothetical protein